MDSTGNHDSLLQLLPNELMAKILAMLDYQDLAICMRVCKRMLYLVGDSSLLQYHLELGRSCMEDGPLNSLSIAESRARLQAYNNAWRNLQWSACIHLLDIHPHTSAMDVAQGGILTFISRSEGKIMFVQLPSKLRGIPMRQWEHSFPFLPWACTLDPSEDVLVVLQREEWRIHFFSLRSGEPHPSAAIFPFSDPPLQYRNQGHIQLVVSRNYIAALVPEHELMIWDWKSGRTVLCITSTGVRSFAFLPENRILLASIHTRDLLRHADLRWVVEVVDGPALAVYNLDHDVSASWPKQRRPIPIAIFALELGHDIIPIDMLLHYRLNVHSYSPEVAVPFFGSPADQLVALQTSGHLKPSDARGLVLQLRHILIIPIAKLLHHIGTTVNNRTSYISWKDWGPTGTHRVPDPRFSHHFQSALSGPRFIPRPEMHNFVRVWDFSRADIAPHSVHISEPVPCIEIEAKLPAEIMGRVTAAISEDVIVLHETRISEELERVYLLVF